MVIEIFCYERYSLGQFGIALFLSLALSCGNLVGFLLQKLDESMFELNRKCNKIASSYFPPNAITGNMKA